jgi:hypothetical protein
MSGGSKYKNEKLFANKKTSQEDKETQLKQSPGSAYLLASAGGGRSNASEGVLKNDSPP